MTRYHVTFEEIYVEGLPFPVEDLVVFHRPNPGSPYARLEIPVHALSAADAIVQATSRLRAAMRRAPGNRMVWSPDVERVEPE